MNSRHSLAPLIVLGILAMVGLFLAAALLPAFVVAVLLMLVILAAFVVLALREGKTG